MEEFKRAIKKRITLFSGLLLVTVVLGVYGLFLMGNSEGGNMTDGIVTGFQFGIMLDVGILSLFQIVKLNKVINDDKKLRILHNKENDERLKAIRSKAGMPMLMITSVIMLIAAIIAGYFSKVVFSTLVITAIVQMSIGAIVKLFYLKTM